jgi:hypothetical protein
MSDERTRDKSDTTVEDRPDESDRQAFEDLAFREKADQSPDQPTDTAKVEPEQPSERRGTAAMAAVQMAEPAGERKRAESASGDEDEKTTPLFDEQATNTYRQRWQEVQSRFVDDPRKAVTEADVLVADLMQTLAKTFADERAGLEETWKQGGNASTEDLRIALQRYRSFFGRLLSF